MWKHRIMIRIKLFEMFGEEQGDQDFKTKIEISNILQWILEFDLIQNSVRWRV